jgi:adenine-specific DNA-methyltransferase
LARNLLRDDGVIFISIDDNEVHNLRAVMNEVFGEANFVVSVIWQKRITPENRRAFSVEHDYVLCYALDSVAFGDAQRLLPLTEEARSRYRNPDNDPRGDWQSVPAVAQAGHGTRSQFYTLKTPSGRMLEPPPGCCWRYTERKMLAQMAANNIWFGADGNGVPRIKRFLSDTRQGITPSTMWLAEVVSANEHAKRDLAELFSGQVIFDAPKPSKLIQQMLSIASDPEEGNLILDFYSGSSTTAQAVLEMNRADGGNRQFIMVQFPEETPLDSPARQAGYSTIADIGKERIRRVIKRMQEEGAGKLPVERDTPEDLGFRVFKLDRSSYKAWRDYDGADTAELQTLFDQYSSPLVDGWQPAHLMVEILLMEGFPLDSTVTPLPAFTHNKVVQVSSDLVAHHLFVCLDEHIHEQTIGRLSLAQEDLFICLDAALTDEAKARLQDGRRVKVI